LPQAIEKLAQLHPNIDVQITVLTSQQTLEQLKSGSLDIGIVALPQLRVMVWKLMPGGGILLSRFCLPTGKYRMWCRLNG
jgi:DNA-binding transcriptional LysR family regulator